jgi:hypothetical protein
VLHLVHVIPPEEKVMVPIMPNALPHQQYAAGLAQPPAALGAPACSASS